MTDEHDDKDWEQYQQNEIDGAAEDIETRLNHISGRVQDGIIDGELLNEHHNQQLKAYIEGYADALDYAHGRVERIDNLMRYATDGDDAEDEHE